MKPIVGSIVALVTPMHEDGSVDYPSLRRLIDWHIAEGTDCIGVVGTTGESPTVSVDEHCEIIRVAVAHAAGRVPIMAGAGGNATAEAIELSRFAKQVGADCTLQVVPYYNRPSQEGIYRHFRAIAEAVDIPVVLYNVPGRTVADMHNDTVLRLAQVDGIVGLKDATGDIGRASWLIKQRAEGVLHLLGRRQHRRGIDAAGRPRQCQRHRERGAARDARVVRGRHRRPGEACQRDPPAPAAAAPRPVLRAQPRTYQMGHVAAGSLRRERAPADPAAHPRRPGGGGPGPARQWPALSGPRGTLRT